MFRWLLKRFFRAKQYGLYISSYDVLEQLETIRGYGGGVLDCRSSVVEFNGEIVSKGYAVVSCPNQAVQQKLESIFVAQGHDVKRLEGDELNKASLSVSGLAGTLVRNHIKRVTGGG